MRYKITHVTAYTYSDSVLVSQNQALLTPRNGRGQTCLRHRLTVHPEPTPMIWRSDYFGNRAAHFSITRSHRRLRVTALSVVRVRSRRLPPADQTPAWESVRDGLPSDLSRRGLNALQFVFDSPHVRRSAE